MQIPSYIAQIPLQNRANKYMAVQTPTIKYKCIQ